MITAKIPQFYWPTADWIPAGRSLQYRSAILGVSKMHFVQASSDVDRWQDLSVLQSIHVELPEPMWDEAHTYETTPRMDGKPQANAQFADLPSELAQKKMILPGRKNLRIICIAQKDTACNVVKC